MVNLWRQDYGDIVYFISSHTLSTEQIKDPLLFIPREGGE